ncbi:EamA family transporter [Paraburkholderia strydomiana]|nr:EamA family transporter [Paraburkholderia strydomiana]
MPAGLTAFVVQTQALFTVVLAALLLGERPTLVQVVGLAIALLGLLLIASALGGNIPVFAFLLTLASAVSWAAGNIVIKTMPKVQMLHLMVWASLIPPIPALAISVFSDGSQSLIASLSSTPFEAFLSPIYLGLVASVAAYAVWGYLLQQYTSAVIAPFALLTPAVGMAVSSIVFGERFSTLRLAGMIVLLCGVAVSAGAAGRLYSALRRSVLDR